MLAVWFYFSVYVKMHFGDRSILFRPFSLCAHDHVCVCVYIHIIHVCIYIYIYIHTHTHIYMYFAVQMYDHMVVNINVQCIHSHNTRMYMNLSCIHPNINSFHTQAHACLSESMPGSCVCFASAQTYKNVLRMLVCLVALRFVCGVCLCMHAHTSYLLFRVHTCKFFREKTWTCKSQHERTYAPMQAHTHACIRVCLPVTQKCMLIDLCLVWCFLNRNAYQNTAVYACTYRLSGNMLLLPGYLQWSEVVAVVYWMGIIAVHVAVKIGENTSVSLNSLVASSKSYAWTKWGCSSHHQDSSCLKKKTYTPECSFVKSPRVLALVELASAEIPLCPIRVLVWCTCWFIL